MVRSTGPFRFAEPVTIEPQQNFRVEMLFPQDVPDEVLDALEDLLHYIVRSFGLQGEALRLAREELVDGWLSVYLRGLDELLTRGGGDYFADNRLTVADLKTFVQTRSITAGNLDHVPTDIVQRLAPGLVEHQQRIESDPRVVAYYAAR